MDALKNAQADDADTSPDTHTDDSGATNKTQIDPVQGFIDRLIEMANDFPCYMDHAMWDAFLSQIDNIYLWDMDRLSVALPFVLTGLECLPSFFCAGLERRFHWQEQQGRIDSRHPDSLLEALDRLFERADLVKSETIAARGGQLEDARRFSSIVAQLLDMQQITYDSSIEALRILFHEKPEVLPEAGLLYLYLLYTSRNWETLICEISGLHESKQMMSMPSVLLMYGAALSGTGDREHAKAAFNGILSIYPDQPDALRGLTACLYDSEPPDQVLSYYKQLIDANPGEIWARLALRRLVEVKKQNDGGRPYIDSNRVRFRPFYMKTLKIFLVLSICAFLFLFLISLYYSILSFVILIFIIAALVFSTLYKMICSYRGSTARFDYFYLSQAIEKIGDIFHCINNDAYKLSAREIRATALSTPCYREIGHDATLAAGFSVFFPHKRRIRKTLLREFGYVGPLVRWHKNTYIPQDISNVILHDPKALEYQKMCLRMILLGDRVDEWIEGLTDKQKQKQARLVLNNLYLLPHAGIQAWNLSRAIYYDRCSLLLNCETLHTSFYRITDRAYAAQDWYCSWEEYYTACAIGEQFTNPDINFMEERMEIYEQMIVSPKNAIVSLPWDM